MNTTPRQAALERATQIRIKWAAYADGQDWIDDLRWLCDAFEQAAPEGEPKRNYSPDEFPTPQGPRCSACGELWSHHGNPNRCPRQELADARAAIREAETVIKNLTKRLIDADNAANLDAAEAWSFRSAVVAALKEGKE